MADDPILKLIQGGGGAAVSDEPEADPILALINKGPATPKSTLKTPIPFDLSAGAQPPRTLAMQPAIPEMQDTSQIPLNPLTNTPPQPGMRTQEEAAASGKLAPRNKTIGERAGEVAATALPETPENANLTGAALTPEAVQARKDAQSAALWSGPKAVLKLPLIPSTATGIVPGGFVSANEQEQQLNNPAVPKTRLDAFWKGFSSDAIKNLNDMFLSPIGLTASMLGVTQAAQLAKAGKFGVEAAKLGQDYLAMRDAGASAAELIDVEKKMNQSIQAAVKAQKAVTLGRKAGAGMGAAFGTQGAVNVGQGVSQGDLSKVLSGAGQMVLGGAGALAGVNAEEAVKAQTAERVAKDMENAGEVKATRQNQMPEAPPQAPAAPQLGEGPKGPAPVGGGSDQTVPEKPETMQAQVDALDKGTNPIVYFPKGTKTIPAPPDDANVTVIPGKKPGAGTYYHDDSITPADIKKAVKNGTFGELLGHTQNKEEATGNGATPAVVVARTPEGTEAKASVVNGADEQASIEQAKTLQEQFPEAKVTQEPVENVLNERRDQTPEGQARRKSFTEADIPAMTKAAAPSGAVETPALDGVRERLQARLDDVQAKVAAGEPIPLKDITDGHAIADQLETPNAKPEVRKSTASEPVSTKGEEPVTAKEEPTEKPAKVENAAARPETPNAEVAKPTAGTESPAVAKAETGVNEDPAKAAYEMGKAAFAAGLKRVAVSDPELKKVNSASITKKGGKWDAWYKGWDEANLAAPVPEKAEAAPTKVPRTPPGKKLEAKEKEPEPTGKMWRITGWDPDTQLEIELGIVQAPTREEAIRRSDKLGNPDLVRDAEEFQGKAIFDEGSQKPAPESKIEPKKEQEHGAVESKPVGKPSESALAEVPSENVRSTAGEGNVEQAPERSGGTNEGRVQPSDRGGVRSPGSVGTGEGESLVSPEREGPAKTGRGSRPKARPERTGFDYEITPADEIGEGSERTKYARNIDAIKVLRTIETEGRSATPEEQSKLVKYTGWGWTGNSLFQEYNYDWRKQREELQELLSEEEYAAARKSKLNAHYTSPEVIKPIWDALKKLGFSGGRILEPSAGIGHFFGLMPRDLWNQSTKTGVELDQTSGKILKQLYQTADARIQGFEKLAMPDGFYDLAISNVPFGNYGVNDRAYNKYHLPIHNYFIARMLDKVRPGGIVAAITSHYTMDASKAAGARKLFADKADLIGAIRLPDTAFKKNAGTEVVTDILFFKRRMPDAKVAGEPFTNLADVETPEGKTQVSEYFKNHPEMVLGEHAMTGTMYRGGEYTVKPNGSNLSKQLEEALGKLPEKIMDAPSVPESTKQEATREALPASGDTKRNALTVKDGKVYRNIEGVLQPEEFPKNQIPKLKGMLRMRDIAREILDGELAGRDEKRLSPDRARLARFYDDFVKQNGLLHNPTNVRVMAGDPDQPFVLSLEKYDAKSKTGRKADIFTKQTVAPVKPIQHVDTAKEAMQVSLAEKGRIDLQRMEQLTGSNGEQLVNELKSNGLVFEHPGGYLETQDVYLSGNVRKKLGEAEVAAAHDEKYKDNVAALRAVIPKDLQPGQVEARLGATWVKPEDVEDFIDDLLGTSRYSSNIQVRHIEGEGLWQVKNSNSIEHLVSNTDKWGHPAYGALDLIKDSLNLQIPTVYKGSGKDRVVDEVATTAARNKLEAIQKRFNEWIFEHPDRQRRVLSDYNELYNSHVKWNADGSHLTFPGMSVEWKNLIRPAQKNFIWKALVGRGVGSGGWHEVGWGKTLEHIAVAMEGRRLGIMRKPIFTVLNPTVGQWRNDWLSIYPQANILTIAPEEFEGSKRREFTSRIATGDYDAVILPHSSFKFIPMRLETQKAFYQEQLDELDRVLEDFSSNAKSDRQTIRQLEGARARWEKRLEELVNAESKDNTINFEDLGVDALFVDEAHQFKNLPFFTKINRLSGLPGPDSKAQRATDMFMKTQYMAKLNNGRGTYFMTGTPLLNSIAEAYTMMRFLDNGKLKELGIDHFDSWAGTFGKIEEQYEPDPLRPGTFKKRRRFASFTNIPELSKAFFNSGDVRFIKDVPEIKLPKVNYHTVSVDRSKEAQAIVEMVNKMANGDKKLPENNPLRLMGILNNAGLDYRLVYPNMPDNGQQKADKMIDNIVRHYEEGEAGKLTQLVFSDIGVQGGHAAFNVYKSIKNKLIARGIPADEIAMIQDYKTDDAKQDLFAKINEGVIRILMGSTQTMGTGVNVQKRVIADHHLTTPPRPGDLKQRYGRDERSGNTNPEIHRYIYVTKNTGDLYMWNLQERKNKGFQALMEGDESIRKMEDIGDYIPSNAEIKAMCSDNPILFEKLKVDNEVQELQTLQEAHRRQQINNRAALAVIPERIHGHEKYIENLKKDIETAKKEKPEEFSMKVGKDFFKERKDAGTAINAAVEKNRGADARKIGSYSGFDLFADGSGNGYVVGKNSYYFAANHETPIATIQSIESKLRGLPTGIESRQAQLEAAKKEEADRKIENGKPFPEEEKLKNALAKQDEINKKLEIGKSDIGAAGEEKERPIGGTGLRPNLGPAEEGEEPSEFGAFFFPQVSLSRILKRAWDALAGKNEPAQVRANEKEEPALKNDRVRPLERAGNIRLDKLEAPEDVIETIRQMAKAGEGFKEQRRGTQKFSDTKQAAQQLVDDGMLTPQDLRDMKKGTALNAEEMHAARSLMMQSAKEVRAAAKKVAADASSGNVMAFEQALAKHQGIQRAVSGATAEAGRALSQFRMVSEAMKAAEKEKTPHERVLEALGDQELSAEAARALAMIPEDDLVGLNRFLRTQKQWSSVSKLEGYWMANVLSGTRTPTKKGFGDVSLALAETTTKGVAGLIDPIMALIQGRKQEHFAREAIVSALAQISAIPEAARKGAFILAHGMDKDRLLNMEMPFKYEFKGSWKNPWNWPGRALGGVTKFFQVTAFQGELHAQAIRQALQEGLRGDALSSRAAELVLNPTDKMIDAATKQAQLQTYTEPPDKLSRALMTMRDKVTLPQGVPLVGGLRPLRFVIPFIQIPYNLAKNSLRYSPLGAARLSDTPHRQSPEASKTLARALIGSAIMGFFAYLAAKKMLTGAPPSSPAERDAWYRAGNQPYSVKIGNRWISYKSAGPFALNAAAVSAMYDKYEKTGERVDPTDVIHIAGAMGQALMDESFLRGLKNLTDALQEPDRYAERFAGGILGGFVPMETAMRQLNDALDGHVRDPKTMSERIMAGLPVVSKSVKEKLDTLGRPVEKEGGKGFNALIPGGMQKAEPKSDMDAELARLHDLGLKNVGYAGSHLTMDNYKVTLTPDERRDYQKVRGVYLQSYLKQTFASPEYKAATDQEKVEMAEEAIRQAGKDAHEQSGEKILAERLKKVHTASSVPRRPPQSSVATQ